MNWYLQDIERLEAKAVVKSRKKKVVFYGSSSFTLWDSLEKSFPDYNAVNLGFGGSTLAACAWFYHRVIPAHKPDAIVIYSGDNDLGDGRNPEEVVIFFRYLINQIRQTLGDIPVCFISIKPSPARFNLRGGIQYANKCIQEDVKSSKSPLFYLDLYTKMLTDMGAVKPELYAADGLHLSSKGYDLWLSEISLILNDMFK